MANNTRQSGLFGTNDWKAIYQTFREADFKSYNYETLRKSFIDYLRVNYPEDFNDYIESSEFVALLDVIAFMGQGLAFRSDLNARENFIDTAERRDSVVKLANLVSYTPKRNITASGYLKVTSIQTTQNITDFNGTNLSNIPIIWNDPANPNWLEQFNTIVNAILVDTQRIGKPGNQSDILGVTTSEYAIHIPDNNLPIAPFTSTVDGQNMNFELVSATSMGSDYIYELPPAPSGKFNMLYRNDKLGYGSPDTGFFFYFKQGILQTFDFSLDQQISNQVIDIGSIQGVNETDTWLFELLNNIRIPWNQVENIYDNGDTQEESSRKVFSVTSRFNDQVTYVFGDGVFSEIPVGRFRAYVRAGNAQTYVINPSEMQGITVAFVYINRQGRTETLTIGLELPLTVSNAQSRETLTDIKQRAPSRYYTQNRMVNGEDYNNFPYTTFGSIIKSKAINRASIGVSRNLDLLDPTGKYSSTVSIGTDGALYQDTNDGFTTLTINNTSDIVAFLNDTLASLLLQNRVIQYYNQNYPRYPVTTSLGNGEVYWNSSTVTGDRSTGFLYNKIGNATIPVEVGSFTTDNTKYITTGAMIKFTAPIGFYFDTTRHLVPGIAPDISQTYIWATVLNVLEDGSNAGSGNSSIGQGPITLSDYVPTGTTAADVIPVFSNFLTNDVVTDCVNKMELNQDFTLSFDNSLALTEERWQVEPVDYADYFVKFESQGNNRYIISYRSLVYFFGSVSDTRFSSSGEIIYDPFTGKTIQDAVTILASNTQPGSTKTMVENLPLTILGQTTESDGYVNDFQVEVASISINNSQEVVDPDFFSNVTGFNVNSSNIGIYVFFKEEQDVISLTRELIIPSSDVVYQYATKTAIENVKYDYPVSQLYYAYSENKFYVSVQSPSVRTPFYTLVEQVQYSMKTGRSGLSYQYRHNAGNTTRIDPATTNIIDVYVVTNSYYNAYQNWIQDTTNRVIKPEIPTINELNQEYGKLQNYKMWTDSVVLNSVVFKPLFGSKADASLQATIKVVRQRSSNASDSEIRSSILTTMNAYFDINNWNFGDTFFFSELSAYLHAECGELISSVVLVPNDPSKHFGDLYEIKCMPNEIFANAATPNDIVVVTALTPAELQIAK